MTCIFIKLTLSVQLISYPQTVYKLDDAHKFLRTSPGQNLMTRFEALLPLFHPVIEREFRSQPK